MKKWTVLCAYVLLCPLLACEKPPAAKEKHGMVLLDGFYEMSVSQRGLSFRGPVLHSLRGIEELTELELLDLSMQPIEKTAGAFEPLSKLKKLEELSLTGQHITDLSVLQDLPLRELNLSDTEVTDLTPLENIRTLKSLKLLGTKVTDLSPLSELPLAILALSHPAAENLDTLKKCVGIVRIGADDTQLPSVMRYRARCPSVKIRTPMPL